ncbi:MAG: histidine kinase dimerization/phosphoacceptor domain -containing protein [Dissulfurispiraceae bacterium]
MMNTIMGLVWWKRVDIDLLVIGTVDAFAVGLTVSFIILLIVHWIRKHEMQSAGAIRRAKEEWEQTFDSMADLIMIVDADHRILRVNRAMAEKLGRSCSETIGLTCYEHVHGTSAPPAFCPHTKLLCDGNGHSTEICEERIGGFYIVSVSPLYNASGGLRGSVHVARDITERKKAEKEKDTLLQEIHHRVKNNMQVISSLLNIQARTIEDKQLRAVFEDCKSRIKAMSLVHEELYQSKNLSQIDVKHYLDALLQGLSYSLRKKADIRLKESFDDIFFNIDTAIPCGMIINELVTNSFKHAFRERAEGEISVALQQENGIFNLTVKDNGAGLPKGFDASKTSSLGLQLVHTLTEQLDGTIMIKSDHGTETMIAFKEVSRGKRNDNSSLKEI